MTDPTHPTTDRDAGGADVVRRAFALRSIDEAARTVDCVASTPAVDSYGDVVAPRWRLERYRANPVVLYNHTRGGELPIGTAENVRLEGDALCATLRLATAEANPKAEQVWQSIRQGTLRTVSVGFVPNDVRLELRGGVEVCVLDDNELHEISVTPVPANPEALLRMRARARGAAPPSRGPVAALPHPEVSTMKFIALAAKLGIAAPTEEAAEAGLLALAEEGAQVRATLGTKSAADTAARVAELSIAAVELPKVKAEVAALRAVEDRRAKAERAAHIDALVEARPEMKDAREALEAFAAADYDRFAKSYPRPANTARERALTIQVAPGGGRAGEALLEEREAPAMAGAEALLDAADHVARELMVKDAKLTYAQAFKQASVAIRDARQAARS